MQALKHLSTKVASRQQILDGYKSLNGIRKIRLLCLYNSALDMLISESDQDLMLIPIDDRMANRAHGAAETTNIRNYRFFNLSEHLERMDFSAQKIGIASPLSSEEFTDKLHDLAYLAYSILEKENFPDLDSQVLVLKILLSSGSGDFGIYSIGKTPVLYAAIYVFNNPVLETLNKGVEEHILRDLWTNKEYLSQAKTVSYLSNSIMADYSKKQGGYQGIRLDEDGNLLEGSIANIAYVLNNGTFCYPPLEKTIKGQTLKKAIEIILKDLVPSQVVKSVKELDLKYDDVYEQCSELLFLQNEKIIPVLKLDGRVIGNGQVGPITLYLQKTLKESQQKSGDLIRGFETK